MFDHSVDDACGSNDKDWYSDFIVESPPSVEKSQTKGRKATGVGVFKLADETQMGSLSSLLTNSSDNSVQNDEGELILFLHTTKHFNVVF